MKRIIQPDYNRLPLAQGFRWGFAPFVLQERRRFLWWSYWRAVKVGDTMDKMPRDLKPIAYP